VDRARNEQGGRDVPGRGPLGVDEQIDSEHLAHEVVVRVVVVGVAHPRQGALDAQPVPGSSREHVNLVGLRDGEQ